MNPLEKYNKIKSQEMSSRDSSVQSLDALRGVKGLFIKQVFEKFEVFTGCETENKYIVFPSDENGDPIGESIFECKEKSSWMARNCLR